MLLGFFIGVEPMPEVQKIRKKMKREFQIRPLDLPSKHMNLCLCPNFEGLEESSSSQQWRLELSFFHLACFFFFFSLPSSILIFLLFLFFFSFSSSSPSSFSCFYSLTSATHRNHKGKEFFSPSFLLLPLSFALCQGEKKQPPPKRQRGGWCIVRYPPYPSSSSACCNHSSSRCWSFNKNANTLLSTIFFSF